MAECEPSWECSLLNTLATIITIVVLVVAAMTTRDHQIRSIKMWNKSFATESTNCNRVRAVEWGAHRLRNNAKTMQKEKRKKSKLIARRIYMEIILFPFIFLSAYNRACVNLRFQLLTDVSLARASSFVCSLHCFAFVRDFVFSSRDEFARGSYHSQSNQHMAEQSFWSAIIRAAKHFIIIIFRRSMKISMCKWKESLSVCGAHIGTSHMLFSSTLCPRPVMIARGEVLKMKLNEEGGSCAHARACDPSNKTIDAVSAWRPIPFVI